MEKKLLSRHLKQLLSDHELTKWAHTPHQGRTPSGEDRSSLSFPSLCLWRNVMIWWWNWDDIRSIIDQIFWNCKASHKSPPPHILFTASFIIDTWGLNWVGGNSVCLLWPCGFVCFTLFYNSAHFLSLFIIHYATAETVKDCLTVGQLLIRIIQVFWYLWCYLCRFLKQSIPPFQKTVQTLRLPPLWWWEGAVSLPPPLL